MTSRERKIERAGRIIFVGCNFCGAVDRPLRNIGVFTPAGKYENGKICLDCWQKEQGVQIGHRKEDKKND